MRRRDFLKRTIAFITGPIIRRMRIREATDMIPMPLVVGPQVRDGDPARAPWPPNVIVTLQDLFPTGPTLVRPNPIEKALSSGKPFQLRLQDANYTPTGSIPTPKWVLDACGSVRVTNTQSNITITMARVWRTEYQSIRANMLTALAIYDGKVPLIFDSWGMGVYPEPFMRYLDDAPTRANLRAAGYTADADKASHLAGLQAHQVFKITRIGFALNPYQVPKSDWSGFTQDLAFVDSFCQEARTLFGVRACLGNNSIRSSYIGKEKAGSFYGILKKWGKPLRFQTATKDRVGDLGATIDWAITLGAYAVELPQGYGSLVTDAYLRDAKTRMEANA